MRQAKAICGGPILARKPLHAGIVAGANFRHACLGDTQGFSLQQHINRGIHDGGQAWIVHIHRHRHRRKRNHVRQQHKILRLRQAAAPFGQFRQIGAGHLAVVVQDGGVHFVFFLEAERNWPHTVLRQRGHGDRVVIGIVDRAQLVARHVGDTVHTGILMHHEALAVLKKRLAEPDANRGGGARIRCDAHYDIAEAFLETLQAFFFRMIGLQIGLRWIAVQRGGHGAADFGIKHRKIAVQVALVPVQRFIDHGAAQMARCGSRVGQKREQGQR